jgi:hypothetical protein
MVSPDQTLRGATMPSLDDVYRKFGETAEAVQLLETDLGTLLLIARAVDKDLIQKPDSACAEKVLQKINRQTLGQLVKNLKSRDQGFDDLEEVLWRALEERNRLQHSLSSSQLPPEFGRGKSADVGRPRSHPRRGPESLQSSQSVVRNRPRSDGSSSAHAADSPRTDLTGGSHGRTAKSSCAEPARGKPAQGMSAKRRREYDPIASGLIGFGNLVLGRDRRRQAALASSTVIVRSNAAITSACVRFGSSFQSWMGRTVCHSRAMQASRVRN